MSSYLVALVVSDFKCISGIANAGLDGNLPIGSCGRSNAMEQLEYGLDVGIRIIEHFQNLFQVKYPLPKCDHIAIPDFAAGAMENWGLVTYR
jgi:aminopeptidase N